MSISKQHSPCNAPRSVADYEQVLSKGNSHFPSSLKRYDTIFKLKTNEYGVDHDLEKYRNQW